MKGRAWLDTPHLDLPFPLQLSPLFVSVVQCFPTFLLGRISYNKFSHPEDHHSYENVDRPEKKRQLVAQAAYSDISNCRTKVPAIIRAISGLFPHQCKMRIFISIFPAEPLLIFPRQPDRKTLARPVE